MFHTVIQGTITLTSTKKIIFLRRGFYLQIKNQSRMLIAHTIVTQKVLTEGPNVEPVKDPDDNDVLAIISKERS